MGSMRNETVYVSKAGSVLTAAHNAGELVA
jgi:hypothetical protein